MWYVQAMLRVFLAIMIFAFGCLAASTILFLLPLVFILLPIFFVIYIL